jgi:hypothetical protein
MTMKNTKTLFLISFFGCFILPGLIGLFAAFSIFFDMSGSVTNWILVNGGIWLLAVYQFIIILITIMLWLTLKLKDVQSITTGDVIKGKKNNTVVKKVETIDISDISASKRKEVKRLEKRFLVDDEEMSVQVKEVKQKAVAEDKPVKATQATNITPKQTPERKIYSAIKK